MSKVIFKYRVVLNDLYTVMMPECAELLRVHVQKGIPCLWALVDQNAEAVKRQFALRGTGHSAEDLTKEQFVDTFMMHEGGLVFHLFDLGEISE